MNRQTREELNQLSKEAFGTRSRWQKLVNNGFAELLERDREVMVPTRKGLELKTFTDRKYVSRHYTVDEVRKVMTDLLAARKAAITPSVLAEIEADKIEDGTTLILNTETFKALSDTIKG
jgi:hypothetical protein